METRIVRIADDSPTAIATVHVGAEIEIGFGLCIGPAGRRGGRVLEVARVSRSCRRVEQEIVTPFREIALNRPDHWRVSNDELRAPVSAREDTRSCGGVEGTKQVSKDDAPPHNAGRRDLRVIGPAGAP